jgi:hypothetical protein
MREFKNGMMRLLRWKTEVQKRWWENRGRENNGKMWMREVENGINRITKRSKEKLSL